MTSTKSAEAISPLRRRMIEDMSVRRFSAKTRHDYVRYIETFAKFLGRSPDSATGEDLRRYQVHQTESGVQPPVMNSSVAALRFFFKITLGRADLATQLARIHYPRRLPRVLSPEDVGRLLEAAPGPGLKYKAAMSVAYGAGLRTSEVVALTVSDIDSKRMLIRVEQGKRGHRLHLGAAHLGLGHDPTSARPYDRAGRRALRGRLTLGHRQAEILPARARPVGPVPWTDAGKAPGGPRRGKAAVLRRPRASRRRQCVQAQKRSVSPWP
jgi:integrase